MATIKSKTMKRTNYLIPVTFLLGILNAVGAEASKINILELPTEIRHMIFSDLSDQDLRALRQTCTTTENDVHTPYIKGLENSLFAFSENKRFPEPDFHMTYLQHIQDAITEMCADSINKQEYVFVPQGSLLENHLSKTYPTVSLYDLLYEDRNWAFDLYKTLFGKDMPEEKFCLALKLLTACLPISYLYVNNDLQNLELIYEKFKNTHGSKLANTLRQQHQTQKYFLLGIDTDFKVLGNEPHFIVINQSDQQDIDRLSQYLPENNPHTIIYNADEEVLSFPDAPEDIGKLILTNSDNQCTSIDNYFLFGNSLTSIDIRGFINLTSIGSHFLYQCHNLTSFDTRGLINATSIGDHFLTGCHNLASIDTRGLINTTSIEAFFLSNCHSLTSLDTCGLINARSIGKDFLFNCYNLESINTRGFINVKSIGEKFLFRCGNMTSFDIYGLINITSIGSYFLSDCPQLNPHKIISDIYKRSNAPWLKQLYYSTKSFFLYNLI